MTEDEKQYWFPAKRFGWGWGVPTAWQGWVVIAAYFALVIAGVITVLPNYGAPGFLAYTSALTAVLIAICWVKGERPQWRWGDE